MHTEHTHEHEHSHTHEHTHSHAHEHTHGEVNARTNEENMALLKYMSSHNYSHAEELKQMAEKLRGDGFSKSAELVIHASEYLIDACHELDGAIIRFEQGE